MTGDEKIKFVEEQITLAERGQISGILCPYPNCATVTKMGDPFCCAQMAAVVMIILDRKEMEDKARMAEAIAEQIDRTPLVTLS